MRIAAVVMLTALLLCAAWFTANSPRGFSQQNRDLVDAPANKAHLAGTDEFGRDRAARISLALILGFFGACAASAFAALLAVGLGSASAFSSNWLSRALLFLGDLSLTLPWLFLLMLVRAALPLNLAPTTSEAVTFLLLAVLGAPAFLRMNHEKMRLLSRADWLVQARVAGLRRAQVARQFWPHVRPLLWVQFLLYVPACMIAEANLGTMGLGLSEPLPSLGTFLANLQNAALLDASMLVYLPVLVLILALGALEMTASGVDL